MRRVRRQTGMAGADGVDTHPRIRKLLELIAALDRRT
jgi:hypothetical protein